MYNNFIPYLQACNGIITSKCIQDIISAVRGFAASYLSFVSFFVRSSHMLAFTDNADRQFMRAETELGALALYVALQKMENLDDLELIKSCIENNIFCVPKIGKDIGHAEFRQIIAETKIDFNEDRKILAEMVNKILSPVYISYKLDAKNEWIFEYYPDVEIIPRKFTDESIVSRGQRSADMYMGIINKERKKTPGSQSVKCDFKFKW